MVVNLFKKEMVISSSQQAGSARRFSKTI